MKKLRKARSWIQASAWSSGESWGTHCTWHCPTTPSPGKGLASCLPTSVQQWVSATYGLG